MPVVHPGVLTNQADAVAAASAFFLVNQALELINQNVKRKSAIKFDLSTISVILLFWLDNH